MLKGLAAMGMQSYAAQGILAGLATLIVAHSAHRHGLLKGSGAPSPNPKTNYASTFVLLNSINDYDKELLCFFDHRKRGTRPGWIDHPHLPGFHVGREAPDQGISPAEEEVNLIHSPSTSRRPSNPASACQSPPTKGAYLTPQLSVQSQLLHKAYYP